VAVDLLDQRARGGGGSGARRLVPPDGPLVARRGCGRSMLGLGLSLLRLMALLVGLA
jgi:hypothetical protein